MNQFRHGEIVMTDAAIAIADRVSARATGRGKFQQAIRVAGHALVADEPEALGGLGGGPNPYDFLSIGLAACTSMTIRLYADRKQFVLPAYTVDVAHTRVHAADCAACTAGGAAFVDRFDLRIVFDSAVDAEMQAKVLDIAGKCPVHRTLTAASTVISRIVAPLA